MAKICLHIYVSGVVQGVFFRANAVRKAMSLGVTGWVRNLPDGRVELMVEGEEAGVSQMFSWCRKGPSGAEVDAVDVEALQYTGEFSDFKIIR